MYSGSLFGWYSMITCFPYAASKHYLAAFAETLKEELGLFGVDVITFDIGHFRTLIIENTKVPTGKQVADYDGLKALMDKAIGGKRGQQPGDPVKGVKLMVDVLRGEGAAKTCLEKSGGKLPLRMPVGADAVELVRGRCEEILGVVKDWEDLSRSTDVPGVEDAREITRRTGNYRPS